MSTENQEPVPTLFEWAGGAPALLRMTTIFYGTYVPEDPLLGPLFADMAPTIRSGSRRGLARSSGARRRTPSATAATTAWSPSTSARRSSEEQRARWVQLLCRSADDARLPTDPEWRAAFVALPRVGLPDRARELAAGRPSAAPHAGAPLVVGRRRHARLESLGARRVDTHQQEADLPGPDEPVSFAQHVKPLFREGDRRSMRFAFDLWSHEDVSGHAGAILDRLRAGTMPCDGAWPEDRVAVFERWIDSGNGA